INPADAEERGIKHDDLIWVFSRRGKVITRAMIDGRVNKGTIYMTYQWWVGKCNELTIHAVDPKANTPEDKYSACNIQIIDDQIWAEQYAQEAYMKIKDRLTEEAARQHGEVKEIELPAEAALAESTAQHGDSI
ncbi:MAG: formate dehydrogenase subunit alpha, partial [Coriobacteriia bacterium]|nr:formate dehydrogenase subunit alpha [Coriobacteriia bacterium]